MSDEARRLQMRIDTEHEKPGQDEDEIPQAHSEVAGHLPPEPEETFQQIFEAAKQGDTAAQIQIACMNEKGQGVPQNLEEAREWFLKAIRSGSAEALDGLRRIAIQGNVEAQKNLGWIYYGKNNQIESFRWFSRAAGQGDAFGQLAVGTAYSAGRGVELDYQKALHWIRLAADQADSGAYRALASMYSQGHGVEQDLEQAINYAQVAFELARDPFDLERTQADLDHYKKRASAPGTGREKGDHPDLTRDEVFTGGEPTKQLPEVASPPSNVVTPPYPTSIEWLFGKHAELVLWLTFPVAVWFLVCALYAPVWCIRDAVRNQSVVIPLIIMVVVMGFGGFAAVLWLALFCEFKNISIQHEFRKRQGVIYKVGAFLCLFGVLGFYYVLHRYIDNAEGLTDFLSRWFVGTFGAVLLVFSLFMFDVFVLQNPDIPRYTFWQTTRMAAVVGASTFLMFMWMFPLITSGGYAFGHGLTAAHTQEAAIGLLKLLIAGGIGVGGFYGMDYYFREDRSALLPDQISIPPAAVRWGSRLIAVLAVAFTLVMAFSLLGWPLWLQISTYLWGKN
jgi:hypothetical protein